MVNLTHSHFQITFSTHSPKRVYSGLFISRHVRELVLSACQLRLDAEDIIQQGNYFHSQLTTYINISELLGFRPNEYREFQLVD